MNTDGLAEFYKDKDIFLSLNKYDTFSIAAAEAMASGLIPVVTKQTGISRYVEDGFNGFTVEYGYLAEFKDIITKILLLNQGDRENIRQNTIKISESLSWSSVYEMYCKLYEGLVK
jgi:glycosyltransferase involved in cell wall biosynthesis